MFLCRVGKPSGACRVDIERCHPVGDLVALLAGREAGSPGLLLSLPDRVGLRAVVQILIRFGFESRWRGAFNTEGKSVAVGDAAAHAEVGGERPVGDAYSRG